MSSMLCLAGLLPFLCLVATIWLIHTKNQEELFLNVIKGALVWSLLAWTLTYSLSFIDSLHGICILAFWLGYTIIILLALTRAKPGCGLPKWSLAGWLAACISLATLVTALAYPPNNYDGLTYHMPRMLHWLQNHTVAPYPTSIDRQIGMAPLNAILMLQTYAPGECDLFVNLVQWFAFTGLLLAARFLTNELGGNKIAIATALIFAATLPTAINQASNTDSCLLVSFYLCAAISCYLKWKKKPDFRWLLWFGLAIGFAILSKGSAYPVALPFICLIAWRCLKNASKLLLPGIAAALVIILLNLPHFYYNYTGTHNLIGSSERNVNLDFSPGILAGNALYNFLVNEPFLLAGSGLSFWRQISNKLGMTPDNPSLLPWGGLEQVGPYLAPEDSLCPNPIHTVFLLLLPFFFFMRCPQRSYFFALLASTLCFCTFLTWHPWITRIQTPLFMLAAPLFGIAASRIHKKSLHLALITLLTLSAIWPLFLCIERPLAPACATSLYRQNIAHFLANSREAALFNYSPAMWPQFREAAEALAREQPKSILLQIGDNGVEYPIWQMLKERGQKPQIGHALTRLQEPVYIWKAERTGENPAGNIEIWKFDQGIDQKIFPKTLPPSTPEQEQGQARKR